MQVEVQGREIPQPHRGHDQNLDHQRRLNLQCLGSGELVALSKPTHQPLRQLEQTVTEFWIVESPQNPHVLRGDARFVGLAATA